MTRNPTSFIAPMLAIASVAIAGPAVAGSPDDPGKQGELIAESRDRAQQLAGGARNGWGKLVSEVSRGGGTGLYDNVGDYLQQMAPDPNPDNDNGGGND